MRDLFLSLFIVGLLPLVFRFPEIGAYLWAWISMMNPHKLTWGFAQRLPWAALIAATTLLAFMFTRKRKPLPLNGITVSLLLLVGWMTVTSVFALNSAELVWDRWIFVMKIHLMLIVTLMLLRGRKHIDILVWVMVVSIGFYGVKGGIWTLLSGGGNRVWGPPGGMTAGNNELAVTLVMLVPLMYYLQQTATRRWVRHAMLFSIGATAFAILGTQSRGALVGILAMAFVLGLKGTHPVRTSLILALCMVGAIAFMPDTWSTRMDTIQNYQADTSAMSRIYTWQTIWNLAVDRPILGGGFRTDSRLIFGLYAPTDEKFEVFRGSIWVAHSIYFQALGEHGFPGLMLYLVMGFSTWRIAGRLAKQGQDDPEYASWLPLLMRMCQVGLIGFAAGGAFLSLMHLDVPYYLVAVVVLADATVRERIKAHAPEVARAAVIAAR